MKTVLTEIELQSMFTNIFNGNLAEHKADNTIAYVNANSEDINIHTDSEDYIGDLAEFLNIEFYAWKRRFESGNPFFDENGIPNFSNSLTNTLNSSYGIVEQTNEEVTASQDIDSVLISGEIRFIVQTNKVNLLDYYLRKLRNTYLGAVQTITNSSGEERTVYLLLGTPTYEQEPFNTPIGECVIVTCNFRISYLNSCMTYGDTKVYFSLNGNVAGNYLQIPFTKMTFQNQFVGTSVPMADKPFLTGNINSIITVAVTISFFDFNVALSKAINELTWSCGALTIDSVEKTTQDVNIPVFMKVESAGKTYVYHLVIGNILKSITNNDYNVTTLSLTSYGKR